MPWQSLPPLAIIVVAIAGMGALQTGVHYLAHGEKRRTGLDEWDHKMIKRDEALKAAASNKSA
jgi:hypothetical protein